MRSALFLPASNPRAIEKARTLPCDVAILDLEDAVAPEMKAAARAAAVQALRDGGFGPRLGVRINGLDTAWGADDLRALSEAGAALIVAPKVDDADAARALTAALPSDAVLWAMIETPRALVNLNAIAAVDRLEALMLGVNDLAIGLRTGPSPDREPLKPWLAATVAAARANGLLALDGVYNAFTDLEGFAAECAQGRLYGFDGKSLIHPSQIAPANAAFGPSEAEIARARAIVAAFALPESEGKGAISVEDEMVERLHLHAAQYLIRSLDRGR
ncbi:HpcH/HpaI aldolase/citrate lyase family protein [Brevundimonas sp. GCM10030266]|uniref:HpcH/HpaI aldolase/citrate lyase family protein n=1 Tax=Brevundimonas sp. GCM10030266 TaxID=3273386 RepID=UPI003622F554